MITIRTGVFWAAALLLGLAGACAAILLTIDLDGLLSSRLTHPGMRVQCVDVRLISPRELHLGAFEWEASVGRVRLEGVRLNGSMARLLSGHGGTYRMSAAGGEIGTVRTSAAGVRTLELGPSGAILTLHGDRTVVRRLRISGAHPAHGGLVFRSGRLTAAHASIPLRGQLRDLVVALSPALGGGLEGRSRLRVLYGTGRLRVSGDTRPLIDLSWAA